MEVGQVIIGDRGRQPPEPGQFFVYQGSGKSYQKGFVALGFGFLLRLRSNMNLLLESRCANTLDRYSHFTVRRNGNQFTVQVFGKEPAMGTCTTQVINFIAPVMILAPTSGAYDFHFWQSDATSIDTSLVIE